MTAKKSTKPTKISCTSPMFTQLIILIHGFCVKNSLAIYNPKTNPCKDRFSWLLCRCLYIQSGRKLQLPHGAHSTEVTQGNDLPSCSSCCKHLSSMICLVSHFLFVFVGDFAVLIGT